jgi:hypothetical protein
MDQPFLEEYAALRATIRERGTARIWMFVFTISAWGVALVGLAALQVVPLMGLVPLLILTAGFEAIFSLHVAVERIGRYLQVFYEDGTADRIPRWETVAMEFGRAGHVVTTDALFTGPILLAAALNLVPLLLAGPVVSEFVVIVGSHVAFAVRVLLARRAAASQRAIDLARFRALRSVPGTETS